MYTQQCDSTQSTCTWWVFDSWCDDDDETLVYIASQADNYWDSFCWNFGTDNWVTMWSDFDSGDDEADGLEAFFEVHENQSGTIPMGTVNFFGLELRDASTWHDWTTAYIHDTGKFEEGGYIVTPKSRFYDFDVDN